eukprot:364829-Chlamydomonas_euryale.AAC.6
MSVSCVDSATVTCGVRLVVCGQAKHYLYLYPACTAASQPSCANQTELSYDQASGPQGTCPLTTRLNGYRTQEIKGGRANARTGKRTGNHGKLKKGRGTRYGGFICGGANCGLHDTPRDHSIDMQMVASGCVPLRCGLHFAACSRLGIWAPAHAS